MVQCRFKPRQPDSRARCRQRLPPRPLLSPPSLLPSSEQKESLWYHQGLQGHSGLALAVCDYGLTEGMCSSGLLRGPSGLNAKFSESFALLCSRWGPGSQEPIPALTVTMIPGGWGGGRGEVAEQTSREGVAGAGDTAQPEKPGPVGADWRGRRKRSVKKVPGVLSVGPVCLLMVTVARHCSESLTLTNKANPHCKDKEKTGPKRIRTRVMQPVLLYIVILI